MDFNFNSRWDIYLLEIIQVISFEIKQLAIKIKRFILIPFSLIYYIYSARIHIYKEV
jgi:hypothetical protein